MRSNSKQSPFVRPWHIDCRLSKELPDDKPVRGRFLAGVVAGTIAAAVLTYCLWALYSRETLASDIADWHRRIDAKSEETAQLRAVGTAIAADATRVDEIFALIHSPVVVSEFIQEAGRTRPAPVRLDMIELNTGTITLRGGLSESSQRASLLLGQYVADLRASPYFRKLFSSITLTSLDRNDLTGSINFEIMLKLKAETP
jgi:hypothetical protein